MIMHFSHFQCLIIGEITCDHMIIVLNKIDLFDSSKRDAQISKVLFILTNHWFIFFGLYYAIKISKKISKTLEATRFNGSVIVPVAAAKPSEVTYN